MEYGILKSIFPLPCFQDGSCNGLQHYAAMGRDVIGGASVNLTPSSVPQDVYSDVAELVTFIFTFIFLFYI